VLPAAFLVHRASGRMPAATLSDQPHSRSVLPAAFLIHRASGRMPAATLSDQPHSRSVLPAAFLIHRASGRMPAATLSDQPHSSSVLPAAFLIHRASGRMPLLLFSLLIAGIVACDPCRAPLRIIIGLNVSTSLRHQIQEKVRIMDRQQRVRQQLFRHH
jgi:hypothetical protein